MIKELEENAKGCATEGSCGPIELEIMKPLLNNVKNVLEIGFNCGYSAAFFLENGIDKVVSFDICQYGHEKNAHTIIDKLWPDKHELVVGDSIKTVPEYNSDTTFDLIFIDGFHWEEHPKLDIQNCKRFAHENTIVVVDNVSFKLNPQILRDHNWPEFKYYCVTDAWNNAIIEKIINPTKIECVYPPNSSYPLCMGIGKYII